MKRTLTIGIGITVILFFTSCQREESINIDQNRIYTEYSFMYDAERGQSIMEASFRLDNNGGKRIELSYPARVAFDGENMGYRMTFGNYQLKRTGSITNGSFVYTDLDGINYENSISSIRSIELPFGLTRINRNGNFFLPWTGDALQPGEIITVIIDPQGEGSNRSFTTSSTGTTHIVLDEFKLKQIEPGFAKIEIIRERSHSITSTPLSGGRMELKYKSREVNVEITE
jgi:hypothetical protein